MPSEDTILSAAPETPAPTAASAPVTASPAGSVLAEGLNFSANWRESLPEDIRAEPSLENIRSLDSLAKTYVSGQKMIGLDKVAIPNEHSPQDVWDEFYTKTGRPSTVDDYDFSEIKAPPEAIPTIEQVHAAKTMMHELGLNDKQAKGIYEYYNNMLVDGVKMNEQTAEREYEEAVTELKEKYGYAYDKQIELANRTIRTFDPDGVIAELGLSNNPKFIDFAVKVGKMISEDKILGMTPEGALTPNDAQTQVNKALANPAYYNADHPEHRNVVAEVERLMKFMHPEEMPTTTVRGPDGRLI